MAGMVFEAGFRAGEEEIGVNIRPDFGSVIFPSRWKNELFTLNSVRKYGEIRLIIGKEFKVYTARPVMYNMK